MLNTKNEKELFCAVLTHCDANTEFVDEKESGEEDQEEGGVPLILDEI